MSTGEHVGSVAGIALRQRDKGRMTEVAEALARENGGLEGDLASRPDRGVTFISAGQWRDVVRALGEPLPWWTRRANVLVQADGLGHLIGRRIRVGEAEVQINAETEPCDLMNRLHDGLKEALLPGCRAGVYGRVVTAGRIRVGDSVTVVG